MRARGVVRGIAALAGSLAFAGSVSFTAAEAAGVTITADVAHARATADYCWQGFDSNGTPIGPATCPLLTSTDTGPVWNGGVLATVLALPPPPGSAYATARGTAQGLQASLSAWAEAPPFVRGPQPCGAAPGGCQLVSARVDATISWLLEFAVEGNGATIFRARASRLDQSIPLLEDLTSGVPTTVVGPELAPLESGHRYRLTVSAHGGDSLGNPFSLPGESVFVAFGATTLSVPEPGTASLLLGAALVAVSSRRCKRNRRAGARR